MKKLLFSTLLLSVIFFSCKKSEEKLLVGKNWTISAITIGGTDFYSLMDACSKDNYQLFSDGGKYEINEGGTKCNASDPQSRTGSWSFNSDKTVLTMTDPDGDKINLTITTLDKETLAGTYSQKDSSGTEITGSVTYKAK